MNYIELINSFWQKDIEFNFSDKEIALYFYLLKVCNSTGWKNPFGLSNQKTMAQFSWGKKSFDTSKNVLKKAGLIDFKPGNGRNNVYQYEIKVVKKVGQKTTLYAALSDTLSGTLSDQKVETSINIKDIDKQNSSNGATAPRPKTVFKKPDLEEVRSFFLAAVGDPKNPDCWPQDRCYNEAAQLFDHYSANGWVQGRGKPIKDWEAACRNWIRNCMKGKFSADRKARETPPVVPEKPAVLKPELPKYQQDLNFLYELYCEDPERFTIRSLDTFNYDHLKASGLMKFTASDQLKLREQAINHCPEAEQDETKRIRLTKLFAVLMLFENLKSQNWQTIYDLP